VGVWGLHRHVHGRRRMWYLDARSGVRCVDEKARRGCVGRAFWCVKRRLEAYGGKRTYSDNEV
jgi:hypothetical protein